MAPKLRHVLYLVGVVVFSIITVASAFGLIQADQAASLSAALTTLLALFGVSVSGVAANAVNKQIKKGAFDDTSPSDQVINGVNQVIANAQTAQAEVQKVKNAVTQAVGQVPVLGPLAQQAINSL